MDVSKIPLLADHLVKLLLLGDSGVGKTCLLIRLCEGKFQRDHLATIGIDVKVAKIKVGSSVVRLQVWDTAGQERFRNITQSYFRNAMGVVLVYDVGDRASLLNVEMWLKQLDQRAEANIAKLLVGNKSDLDKDKWQITEEDADLLATKFRLPHLYTSASNGKGVREAFEQIAIKAVEQFGPETQSKRLYPILSDVFENKSKKPCC
eukprot:Gregarina_sp_Pseudo_9__1532@NODE_2028_length_1194_cov_103_174026_g1873_i0_p1_GENE_NODE_2028_length_1194_cov_103_174026_g1873_i0NODE_2028_length_1194_cov_103_174026_g1873_i0_p1_ORF_typecomplete_len206_score24_34Ras/PF00071_22/1_5e54Roc/PF08477_13/1_5e27Arf/PF00025_21/9_1e21GTP_EFTU/PF00009_27/2_3e09SRPRB/PF09439_10/1e08Gtr1_RagA/PF04670_12/3_1e08FeoB_N/PF02421_18/9_5e08AAA_22/PF13401_6/0_00014AAA_22/PF13401_6/1_3e03RsgA_GTPase/PF03193_16/0_81RsgA_GTPase/PF03193_16/0_094MMR_HSR1/PF01926_23/0_00018